MNKKVSKIIVYYPKVSLCVNTNMYLRQLFVTNITLETRRSLLGPPDAMFTVSDFFSDFDKMAVRKQTLKRHSATYCAEVCGQSQFKSYQIVFY